MWQYLVNKEKKKKRKENTKVPTKEVKFQELPQWLHYFSAVWEIPICNG